jgi:hypothetical protein
MPKKTAKHATKRLADSSPQQSGLIVKVVPSAVGADCQGKEHPTISDDEVRP